MENKDEKTQIGPLRNRLCYKSRAAMETAWQAVFPGELLPEDYTPVSREKVLTLVEYLAVPKQGRPGDITRAAKALWDEMAEPELLPVPSPAPPPETKPEPLPQPTPQPDEKPKETPKPAAKKPLNRWQIGVLGLIFLAATLASFKNILHISSMLSEDYYTAKMYAFVISFTGILMVLAGIRNWFSTVVVLLTIGFEGFCNLASTYRPLMGTAMVGDHLGGQVSEFLNTVTSVTNSGFQGTAVGLGIFVALTLASVQLAAFVTIKKG